MTDTSPPRPDAAVWPKTTGPVGARREGSGWVLFAGIMLALVGVLNVIYGVAAIGDSRFFVDDATYILSGLNTWGWIMLILGATQLVAAYSIWKGGEAGRWFGIVVAALNAIAALMSVSAYPFWSLAVFTLGILVIYGWRRTAAIRASSSDQPAAHRSGACAVRRGGRSVRRAIASKGGSVRCSLRTTA